MISREAMKWYVRQFLEGNYGFRVPENDLAPADRA
jgi:hypothetical protein